MIKGYIKNKEIEKPLYEYSEGNFQTFPGAL
jgi:hypothetical protein